LSARAQASGLVLDDQLPANEIAIVDPHALMTVMRNLIGNAIEHAAPATMTVRMLDGVLHIEDDGPGIAAADLPHVFERYFSGRRRDSQVERTATGRQRGLGLAIAKRVCDLHGWSLTARPRDGIGGVTFLLALN
ncbi:MAG: ATP-binding protein, partial [Burkholderiaceae bacterium]